MKNTILLILLLPSLALAQMVNATGATSAHQVSQTTILSAISSRLQALPVSATLVGGGASLSGVSTTSAVNTSITGVSTTISVEIAGVSTTNILPVSLNGVSTTDVMRMNLQGVSTTAPINVAISGVSTTSVFNGAITGVSTTTALNVSQTNIVPNFSVAATVSSPNVANFPFAVKVSNTARLGMQIMNSTDVNCWVKFGTAPTSGSYTVQINSGGYYNMTYPVYTGALNGICSASATTGVMSVTEQ